MYLIHTFPSHHLQASTHSSITHWHHCMDSWHRIQCRYKESNLANSKLKWRQISPLVQPWCILTHCLCQLFHSACMCSTPLQWYSWLWSQCSADYFQGVIPWEFPEAKMTELDRQEAVSGWLVYAMLMFDPCVRKKFKKQNKTPISSMLSSLFPVLIPHPNHSFTLANSPAFVS